MKKAFLGNNCGIVYRDKFNNVLLLSVTPHIFKQGDPVSIHHNDKWITGRVEYDKEKFNGHYFFNESEEENHIELKTGMKIKYLLNPDKK